MTTLDELKSQWERTFENSAAYDAATLNRMIKASVKKHTRASMHYFWASFTLQVMVYALFSHLMIKYWYETKILLLSLVGILIFLPFTILLMRKFKRFFWAATRGQDAASMRESILQQRSHLESFFRFKKIYEWVLIPLSSAIGVTLVFTLYVPGSMQAFPVGALITYLLTLLSCYLAIRSENRKCFVQPIARLNALLDEYKG